MVHASPQTAQGSEGALPRSNAQCAECLQPYTPRKTGQLFCSPEHRNAFQDRCKVRGRQLLPLEMCVMATRQGRTGEKEAGVKAARSANALKRRWIVEDREAGRMRMDVYIRRLIRHHDLP